MPFSYAQYAGNGSATTFSVPFPYLLKGHVKLYTGYDLVAGTFTSQLVDGVGFTWTSGTQVQTTVAPAAGVTLTIIRDTPDSSQLVTWNDGSNLVAADQNTADLQNLYVVQEQQDRNDAVAAQQASTTALANATAAAVANVLLYDTVANVAAIPAAPVNGARVEVLNSTGIQSFTPLAGMPAGFVGGSQLKVRLTYATSGATWNWVDYVAGDPDGRYVRQSSVSSSVSSSSTTTVANSAAVKTAKDAADAAQSTANAALPEAGGTMTGDITFNAGQAFPDVLPLAGGTMTGNLTLPSINGGPLAGFRNRIINGGFDIWQSGTSFTGNEYGADQWIHGRNGTTHTVTQQAFALGQTDVPGEPEYFCRTVVSSVAGAGNFSVLYQPIEGVRTFAGQQVTISFWAKADSSQPIAVELVQFFGTGGSPSATVTAIGVTKTTLGTSWQKVTVTATVPSISGKTIGSDRTDYLVLNIWFDAGSTFNSRTSSLGQQSGTFDIAQVQIEPGPVATPFERRPIGTELALCQRYFCKSYEINVTPGSVSSNRGNPNSLSTTVLGWIACNVSFPVTMRSSPSVIIYQPSTGAIGTIEESGETGPRTVASIETGANGIGLLTITPNSPAAATAYQFQYTASARL